jgi:peptidoglycan/xylan/chitin deacetylase (PgdA/CDA1 family)
MSDFRTTATIVSTLCLAAVTVGLASSAWAQQAAAGATRIARWKDDKKAAFLLMFDDSAPSHVKNVVPELVKRGFIGTFYINPGKGEWKVFKDAWEKDIPAAGMEYANHTATHKGARDVANLEEEILQCNEVILRLFPGKSPRLISFGRPGVPKEAWNITPEQLAQTLAKHHLIERPTFDGHGGAIHHKTADDMMRLVDRAIASGGMEYIIYHGVGGDWISVPAAAFTEFLDRLAAKRDQVWVTGHISAHKYETERATAEAKVAEANDSRIRLELTSKADPKFYDFPLTLITQVPAAWKVCEVVQGPGKATVPVAGGTVQYQALPNAEAIVIQPAPAGKG